MIGVTTCNIVGSSIGNIYMEEIIWLCGKIQKL